MNFLEKLGATLALLGILAIVLDFFNRVPRVLMWIYNWGDGTAWIIKIGLTVGGGILYWVASKPKNTPSDQQPNN